MISEVQDQESPIPEDVVLQHAIEELAQVQARVGAHFRRAEVRNRAGRFVRALLAPVERKNGWQLAEELGECSPHGVQRLLAEATGMRKPYEMNCADMWSSTWGTQRGYW